MPQPRKNLTTGYQMAMILSLEGLNSISTYREKLLPMGGGGDLDTPQSTHIWLPTPM